MVKNEKTLCERCEALYGKCNKRNISPWCCTDRMKAFQLIEPLVKDMVDILLKNKYIDDSSVDRYLRDYLNGNLINTILTFLEEV